MEPFETIAWFVVVILSLLAIIGYFKMWFLLERIRESAALANQKLASQTGLLERCAQALEGSAGKVAEAPPPADQTASATKKGLSLGGHNP